MLNIPVMAKQAERGALAGFVGGGTSGAIMGFVMLPRLLVIQGRLPPIQEVPGIAIAGALVGFIAGAIVGLLIGTLAALVLGGRTVSTERTQTRRVLFSAAVVLGPLVTLLFARAFYPDTHGREALLVGLAFGFAGGCCAYVVLAKTQG